MSKEYNGPGTDELMEEVINLIEGVTADWEKIKNKHNAAAGRRIRKSLDEIAKIKVDVRKAMLKEGR
jgi:hypothetical protein